MKPPHAGTLTRIAVQFFSYLGSHLPIQCASDEFYFFPRCQAAVAHMGTLDDLHPGKVQELLSHVSDIRSALPREPFDDIEAEIDRVVLRQSIDRFLWEYGSVRTWASDPTLYIKIPLFAVDDILSLSGERSEILGETLDGVVSQIPQFLQQGLENLHRPSQLSVQVAVEMTEDARAFFEKDVPDFIATHLPGDPRLVEKVLSIANAWSSFRQGLHALETSENFRVGYEGFAQFLASGLAYHKTPDEVLVLATEGFQSTRAKLAKLAAKIDLQKSWLELLNEEASRSSSPVALLDLYSSEVQRLRDFFASSDAIALPLHERVAVSPTPRYLQALRATAAYRATLTGRPDGIGVFQITPRAETSALVRAHVSYLTAHETYPGHHLLDTIRIRHLNPIRRQIESPLYYEGWACYAETLLDDLGYVTDPRRQLMQLQRQLWRDLRAILDVKLQTGRISLRQAAQEIEDIGFSEDTARRQVRRFALTPAYQSCYFLGMHEILRLRDAYVPGISLKTFHQVLLEGGQIPFELVQARLKRVCAECGVSL